MPKITIVTFEGSMGEVVNYHRLVSRPYAQGRNPRNLRALNNAHTWTRDQSRPGSQENAIRSDNLHEVQLESNVGQTANEEISSGEMTTDTIITESIDVFPEVDPNSRSVASIRLNVPLLTSTVESSNIANQMEQVTLTEENNRAASSKPRKRH